MKRTLYFFFTLCFLLTYILLHFGDQRAISNSSGSANNGGNSGSVGDGGTTCAQSFCHDDASPQFNSGLGSISTSIPASGYVPGQTYTITASINKSGHNKFGFELTSETPTGTKTGMLSSTSSSTQTTNGGDAITHTSSGNSGSGGRSWSMDWQAPSAGTGEVVFWAAFNVTNSNGGTGGDTVHVDSITVQEDSSSTAIPSARMYHKESLKVFPNPARERITIKGVSKDLGEGELILRDLHGKAIRTLYSGDLSYLNGRSFELDKDLSEGAYLLDLDGEKERALKRILVR